MSTPAAPEEPRFNVFLSWSGDRSRAVAKALHEWLPLVVQAARPWMSTENIASGQRWRQELGRRLESIQIGIVCACPENLESVAIHFEAGALSRQVEEGRLIPYCFDLPFAQMGWPLTEFQGAMVDRSGTRDLVKSVSSALPNPLPQASIDACFESLWPRLEEKLSHVPARPTTGIPKAKSTDEMTAEILERVRSMERQILISRSFSAPATGMSRARISDEFMRGLIGPSPASLAFEAKLEEMNRDPAFRSFSGLPPFDDDNDGGSAS